MKLLEFKNQNNETLRGIVDTLDSNEGIIFVHGLERTTIEMKFKILCDQLRGGVNLFRFDFSGCGMSDGIFEDITIEKLTKELDAAIKAFKKEVPTLKKLHIVAHSLGCCVALQYAVQNPDIFTKMLFLGPAFNQKEILRYFFTQRMHHDSEIKITWQNYKEFFNEEAFCQAQLTRQIVASHFISPNYFKENSEMDYQELFEKLNTDCANIFILEGEMDVKVPPESNNKLPSGIRRMMISGADHDFERPDMVEQYIREVISFLSHQKT